MVARVIATLALSAGLFASAAGCSSEGASTSCSSTSACTITFDRGVDGAKASVLGVEVALVSATDTTATLKVAGQEVTVQNDQKVEVGDFTVTLKGLTESEAKVEIAR
ncbi:hypothetical protein Rhe02_85700 [Rhizocola hellebori]|uniref:Uncharacterized protein n=1 Tax=Rhizocola hellebori TaxID=1392758 RepID=A0A8J3QGN6_9ACTN|nr:hypothetical protein [Rhizocola hellebori]GIH10503.1 hypothetical protein Rhe02_85700 [Rhizocola hellebori]